MIKLVLANLDKNWHWPLLSCNPNIYIKDIFDHEELPWSFIMVSKNINLKLEDILTRPNLEWSLSNFVRIASLTDIEKMIKINLPINYQEFSKNKNISMNLVLKNLDKTWSWAHLSKNLSIKLEEIYYNRDKPWSYKDLSDRTDINMSFINKIDPKFIQDWSICDLSCHLPIEDIIQNESIDFSWTCVSTNLNLTFEDVLKYDRPWSIEHLSKNKNIMFKDVLKYYKLSWSWSNLSLSYDVSIDFIINKFDEINKVPISFWSWYRLSANDVFEISDIANNMDLDWDFFILSGNSFGLRKYKDYPFIVKKRSENIDILTYFLPFELCNIVGLYLY